MDDTNRSALDRLNSDQIYSLSHEVIDQICGICPLKTSKYVPNYWPNEDQFRRFVDYFQVLLSNLIDIRAKHESLKAFSEETQKVILDCIEVRRPELRKAIINNTIAENNPVLKDFFWRLNVVLDSDRMTDINEPVLNLDLNLSEGQSGSKSEKLVSLEFNREELSRVLKTLEEAQQELRNSY